MQLVGPVLTGSLHQSQYLLVVWSGNFMAKTGILSTSKTSYGDGPDFLMMKRKKTESGML